MINDARRIGLLIGSQKRTRRNVIALNCLEQVPHFIPVNVYLLYISISFSNIIIFIILYLLFF